MSLQMYNPQQAVVAQYASATVIGLGVTGYSVARYLRARGLSLTILDSRSEPPLAREFKRELSLIHI